jgi:hypothetical protein
MFFELRMYKDDQFGDAFEFDAGKDLADFEEYVEQFTTYREDAGFAPFDGIVAGRTWTDPEGHEVFAFAYGTANNAQEHNQ